MRLTGPSSHTFKPIHSRHYTHTHTHTHIKKTYIDIHNYFKCCYCFDCVYLCFLTLCLHCVWVCARVTTHPEFVWTVWFSSPLSGPLLLLHVLLFGQLSSFSRVKVVVTPVCVCVCDCVKERMREAECLIKIVAVLLKLLNNSVLHRRLW